MSLTHLEHGGWAVADLKRLSVYELDEDTGTRVERALGGGALPEDAEVLEAAVASGVLVQDRGVPYRMNAPRTGQ